VRDLFDLTDRTAIITGGRKGLGQVIAKGLNDYGANIAVIGRTDDFEETLSICGNNSIALKVDITKDNEVVNMVKKVKNRFGTIDILVNNAAISPVQDTLNISPEEFMEVFEVNVLGMFLCCRGVFSTMEKRGCGKIINIASIYGMSGVDKSLYLNDINESFDIHSYTSSKGAVINLTRDLAVYWGRFGINVNSISPGTMMTEEHVEFFNRQVLSKIKDRTPLKRIGNPTEIIGSVIFLASEASSYVNGANIVVDGGWTCW
jgi:NAD(P)-dependent dehydrogenase (short-subunit alcohol dehydrogenase family)